MRKILRISNLPTPDFPASGLTSHQLINASADIIAIPFPKKLCLHEYDEKKVAISFALDLRSRKLPKIIRILLCILHSVRIALFVRYEKIKIIHIHWVPLLFIVFFVPRDTKCFLTVHGEDAKYLTRFVFKGVSKRLQKIFVVGSYWTNHLASKNFVVDEIPNFSPIDEPQKYSKFKSALNTSVSIAEPARLCVIASDKEHKNLKIFKHISDELKNLIRLGRLRIDFVGVSKPYLGKFIDLDDVKVVCHDRCSREKTLSILGAADLLLLPSVTEGNPKVVWEAVTLGVTPVMSSTLTFWGFNHVHYPHRFDPENALQFCEVILRALKTPMLASDLGKYFQPSGYQQVLKIYNECYERED